MRRCVPDSLKISRLPVHYLTPRSWSPGSPKTLTNPFMDQYYYLNRDINHTRANEVQYSTCDLGVIRPIPLPLNPSMSHGVTSRPETPLSFQQHGHQGQPEQSGSKKSLFRGRMGKRLSESVSSGTAMTDDQEKDTGDKRMSVLQRAKRWNSQPENHRKCCIAGMADSATY
jgi:hypothetical protein